MVKRRLVKRAPRTGLPTTVVNRLQVDYLPIALESIVQARSAILFPRGLNVDQNTEPNVVACMREMACQKE